MSEHNDLALVQRSTNFHFHKDLETKDGVQWICSYERRGVSCHGKVFTKEIDGQQRAAFVGTECHIHLPVENCE